MGQRSAPPRKQPRGWALASTPRRPGPAPPRSHPARGHRPGGAPVPAAPRQPRPLGLCPSLTRRPCERGGALRGIIKRARARRPRQTEGRTHKDGCEGRVHRAAPGHAARVALGRAAGASGRGHRRSRSRGQWVGAAGTPGGSRAGRAPLRLPNSPASGREA